MAVPPAPDDRSGVDQEQSPTLDTDSTRARGSGARTVVAAVLVVLVLATAGLLVWLVAQRTGDSSDLQSQREKAMSQASAFVLRVNTYGPDLLDDAGTMPDYRAAVGEVITPKFAESFEQSVPAAEATVAQADYARKAEVFGAGISVIDGDSASALVAGSFTSSYPGADDPTQRIDDVPLPFRVQVQLVKVEGEWLVDGFTPVTGEGEEPSGSPSGSPTASPSEEASP